MKQEEEKAEPVEAEAEAEVVQNLHLLHLPLVLLFRLAMQL